MKRTMLSIPGVVLLLVSLANAFSINRDHALDVAGPLSSRTGDSRKWMNLRTREDGDNDIDPQCDNACLPEFRAINARRDLENVILSRNISLVEREMTLPGANMNDFMREEMPSANRIVFKDKDGHDVNTAVERTYGRNAFSLGTDGLCGCTSLWIISRLGVYGTHYWEGISFAPQSDYRLPGETNAQIFKRTILDPLRNGAMSGSKHTQFKLDPDKISDNFIQAYLVHPEMSCGVGAKLDGYRTEWNKIKKAVGEIIPALDPKLHQDRWHEIIYIRQDRDDPILDRTALGKVLFKFDPKHGGRKKAALWVEHQAQPYHDDSW